MTISVPVNSVAGDDTIPQRVDVVIIGGGIIGVTTALELAERGVSVALCEKGVIAGEQSSRNWGWVRQMGREEAELPLAIESLRLWKDMDRRIGAPTGYDRRGIMYVAYTRGDEEHWTDWHRKGLANGVRTELLSGDAARARLAGMSGLPRMALHSPEDGSAEPWIAVPAMAEAARRAGAVILTNCAVRTVDSSGGRVSGVITERGRIACSQVAICGGAWSRLFAGNLGIDLPSLKVIGTVARVSGVEGVPDIPVGTEDFSFRKRLDGQLTLTLRNANIAPILIDNFRLLPDYLPRLRSNWREFKLRIGPSFIRDARVPRKWSGDDRTVFEEVRTLDPKPSALFLRKALSNATRAFPAFSKAVITRSWAGAIDVTPDTLPVIDAVPGHAGLFLAAGFSGHGFGIGPASGKLLADLMMGEKTDVDASPYRLGRFKRSLST